MFAGSSLSLLASGLRTLLAEHIDGVDVGDVLIGTPRQARELAALGDQGSTHALNVFFYRFEPGAYPSATRPDEPFYVRAHCLLTAFASKNSIGEDAGSAGQNDLHLLGEAMRVLHQHPSLPLPGAGDEVAAVQIVPLGLSIQEINQIWSMLGVEVGYRPSAAYELALVPIPLATPVDRRPRVARTRADVGPRERLGPPRRWTPRLVLVHPDGPAYALSVPLVERPATLTLQLHGRVGERVILRWRLLGDRTAGWTDGPSSAPWTLVEETSVHEVELPLAVAGQALVWAEPADDPGNASDPVMVILYDEVHR